MSNTYTWAIEKLTVMPQHETHVNAVKYIHYAVTATSPDGISLTDRGIISIADPNENFVPFEELTEQQVLSWVWASLGGTPEINKMMASMDARIENIRTPPMVEVTPPWTE